MKCLQCQTELKRLDNTHLLSCSGLTLQEYAIRHHLPLELLLAEDQINVNESANEYQVVSGTPGKRARSCIAGVQLAGLLHQEAGFTVVPGDIKRLDLLLWLLQRLQELGFQFRQDYCYSHVSHRVIARNRLKTLSRNLCNVSATSPLDSTDLLESLAVLVALVGELHVGYLFLPIADQRLCDPLIQILYDKFRISFKPLKALGQPQAELLRSKTPEDAARFLALLRDKLLTMPGLEERFFESCTQAMVVKELVFDSAHFITDHPGKCANLHGGRYVLTVKVKDRIDPATGFVLDYGYLKKVVKHLVVERLDHQNLNYVDAALAWRSSTELLCVFIWEQLIDYLPGLEELQLHETDQSYCCYSGPSLAEYQAKGGNRLLKHFMDPNLGKSPWRHELLKGIIRPLKVVGNK